MSDPQTPVRAADAALPERAFAERLADFAKVLAIYPDANERVRRTLEEALAPLREVFEGSENLLGTGVALLFVKRDAVVGEVRIRYRETSNLAWLRERLDRCALAGLEFLHGVEGDAVIEFMRRLMTNSIRRELDVPFEELWPDEYPGLRLIDRRFEGSFQNARLDPKLLDDAERKVVDTSDEQSLARLLVSDEAVVELLLDIQDLLAQQAAQDGQAIRSMDLLGRIIKFMPAETMQDYDKVLDLSKRVLEVLLEQLQEGAAADDLSAVTNEKTLRTLMFVVSRSLFARQAPSAGELAARVVSKAVGEEREEEIRPQGHAGDDAILDDREALFEEIRGLGPTLPAEGPIAFESTAEQLGVLLHFYVRLASAERQRAIEPRIVEILRVAGERELTVLREYVEPLWGEAHGDAARGPFERILDLLRAHDLAPLLRTSGALTLARAREQFPRYFTAYVDTLDLGTRSDAEELAQLCLLLGHERILASGETLSRQGGMLEPQRVERVLAASHAGHAPLVRLVLEAGKQRHREAVAGYARRLNLEEPAASILRLPGSTELATTEYLGLLLTPASDTQARERLARLAVRTLFEVVKGRDRRYDAHTRALAVHDLAAFRDPEIVPFLQRLRRSRRWLVLPREPRCVRDAAAAALKALENR